MNEQPIKKHTEAYEVISYGATVLPYPTGYISDAEAREQQKQRYDVFRKHIDTLRKTEEAGFSNPQIVVGKPDVVVTDLELAGAYTSTGDCIQAPKLITRQEFSNMEPIEPDDSMYTKVRSQSVITKIKQFFTRKFYGLFN